MQPSGVLAPPAGTAATRADAGAAPPLGRTAGEAVGPAAGDPADHEIDELGTAVSALLRTWHGLTRRGAERTGLTACETAALIGTDELRLSALAELRNVDQSVISRQVGELADRGLVDRRPDPSDRRASLVRLTPEGLRQLAATRSAHRAWLRAALARTRTTDVRAAADLISALTTELPAHADTAGPPPPPL